MIALRQLVDSVLSALIAPPCAVCGVVLEQPLTGAICTPCWKAVVPVAPPLCRTCGDPLPSWRIHTISEGRCPRCRRRPPVLIHARAIGAYEGALREIIHALKYKGRRSVGPQLARLMQEHGRDVLRGADAIVPVPLHARRQRERGFNQAEDLARGLDLPIVHALRRVKSTRPQVELPAAQRHRNVRDAFAIAGRGGSRTVPTIRSRIIVLVDDVATTGATLEACARVLKAAGATEVRALTAARVVSARR